MSCPTGIGVVTIMTVLEGRMGEGGRSGWREKWKVNSGVSQLVMSKKIESLWAEADIHWHNRTSCSLIQSPDLYQFTDPEPTNRRRCHISLMISERIVLYSKPTSLSSFPKMTCSHLAG